MPSVRRSPPPHTSFLSPPAWGGPPWAWLYVSVLRWTVKMVGAPGLEGWVDGPSLKMPPPRLLAPLPPAPPAPPWAWLPVTVRSEEGRVGREGRARRSPRH